LGKFLCHLPSLGRMELKMLYEELRQTFNYS